MISLNLKVEGSFWLTRLVYTIKIIPSLKGGLFLGTSNLPNHSQQERE
jgi:hypothetical protein